MATGEATVTATTGAGLTVTAKVIENVKAFFVDIEKMMLYFHLTNSDPTGPMQEYALTADVTFTATITDGAWEITVVAS